MNGPRCFGDFIMAVIFPLPTNVPEEVSTGYQRQNTLFYAHMTGHLNLGLSNMENSSAPKVLAGSVFELNGGLFKVTADESITGTPSTGQNYVYAVPNAGGASFKYSAATPSLSVEKGGWYNGNNRAVAKAYYVTSQYNNKVILDSYEAMYTLNVRQTLLSTGGTLIITGTVNEVKTVTLEAGYYWCDMKGGTGGNGGLGGNVSNYIGSVGGSGSAGEQASYHFILKEKTSVNYAVGGDGNDGGDGGFHDGSGGGGGGCTGGTSFFDSVSANFFVFGGSGGGGGGVAGRYSGINSGGCGGGVGGGYGTAQYQDWSYAMPPYGAFNGFGGNDGIGGDGGPSIEAKGGDGNGYKSGYGLSGEKGTGAGGAYGGGSKRRQGSSDNSVYIDETESIAYQGGGGGGGAIAKGGAGGGGLKATSSGYVRIYRLG
jgi:hypothetical protein